MPFERVERLHAELPMFRVAFRDGAALYTPGLAVVEEDADRAEFERRAMAAEAAWRQYVERPFVPQCLTLYLSNQCNLGCSYCYSAPLDPSQQRWRARPVLDPRAALAAARLVIDTCAGHRRQFSLIFHGGGEPTQHWALLQQLRAGIGRLAADSGVDLWSYIATNGVLSEAKVGWLIEQFSMIGLSCDGPPDVQDRQRATFSGSPTSVTIERTARLLARRGADFHIRATITPRTVRRQSELVAYFAGRMKSRTLRFEPAYQSRPGEPGYFTPADAELFADHFLEARERARVLGAELHLSGARLDDIHGPHCNPLRDVLQVSPDGQASACFLTAEGDRPDDGVMALGGYDPVTEAFVVDAARAAALRRRAARIPSRCHSCVNVYHCARDCPDVCIVSADPSLDRDGGFRCRVQKLISHALIKEWVTHGRTESLQGS